MATLRINSSRPVLTAKSTRAQIKITNKMRKFTVKRTPPKMTAKRQAPQMRVNWRKTNAQMGRRSPELLRAYLHSKSQQNVRAYIERTASEGSQVARVSEYVGSDSDPFAQIQIQRMESAIPETNIASMPQESPEISWTPGSMQVEWTVGELESEWDDDFMPEFEVTPYSLEIRLQGRPEVHITVDGENVPRTVGARVNRKV